MVISGLLLGLPPGEVETRIAILACRRFATRKRWLLPPKYSDRVVQIIHVAFSNTGRRFHPFAISQEECSTMTFTSRLAVVALASLLATGTAFAQTAAPAAKAD